MNGNPWGKFFWNDWETDPALRLCSLAAQGLWMRLLCLAAKGAPTGYVTVAGRAPSLTDLSVLTGRPVEEVTHLMDELDRNGVFSRDAKGRVYSRRMVRDARRAATARKNGQKGGNPTLSTKTGKPGWDNPEVKGRDKPQKPEARSQTSESPSGDSVDQLPLAAVETKPNPKARRKEYPQADKLPQNGSGKHYPDKFEELWQAYPKQATDTKPGCYNHWARHMNDYKADADEIIRAAKRYARDKGGDPYRLGLLRWCREGLWTIGEVAEPARARTHDPNAFGVYGPAQ